MRSITFTLDTLTPPDLASLCPRLWWATQGSPASAPGEARCWEGPALVRLHGALGAFDGRPVRSSPDADARLLPLAAGVGPVVVTDLRVVGTLRATVDRRALGWELAWSEVDDISPAASGGVLLLASALLGGVTLDPVRSTLRT